MATLESSAWGGYACQGLPVQGELSGFWPPSQRVPLVQQRRAQIGSHHPSTPASPARYNLSLQTFTDGPVGSYSLLPTPRPQRILGLPVLSSVV